MKRILTESSILFLILTVVVFGFPVHSDAAGMINTSGQVQFTVHFIDGTTPIPDSTFEMYRVADADAYARLTVTDTFKQFPVAYDEYLTSDTTQEKWAKLAVTLKNYVQTTNVKPDTDKVVVTNENGLASFYVTPGLYLVIGYRATLEKDYYTYTSSPFMVFLPATDSTTGDWIYTASATPKFTKAINPDPDEEKRYVTRKVILTWDDEGYEDSRPEFETVMLFCDGELYDTVLLSESNNWRYSWDNLDPDHEWVIAQVDPNGYTVTLSDEGITHVIENYYRAPAPTPSPTPSPYVYYVAKLPQTGVLWWPVPVLAALGILLIVIGVCGGNREKRGRG